MNPINLILKIETSEVVSKLNSVAGFIQQIKTAAEKPAGLFTASGDFIKFEENVAKVTEKVEESKAAATPKKGWQSVFTALGEHAIKLNQSIESLDKIFGYFISKTKDYSSFKVLRDNFIGTTEELNNFQKATANSISDGNLIKLSNQATDLGISIKDQTILFSLADDAADKYGTSVEEGFTKIIAASEGSSKGLKALGIQKAFYEEKVKELSAAQGTSFEKLDAESQKQIRLQAIIEASNITYENAVNKKMDDADRIDNLSVVFERFTFMLTEELMPPLINIFTYLSNVLEWLNNSATIFGATVKSIILTMSSLATAFILFNSSMGATPYIIVTVINALLQLYNGIKSGNFVQVLTGVGLAIAGVFWAAKEGLLKLNIAMLTSPIGIAIMGIVTVLALAASAISKFANSGRDAAAANLEQTETLIKNTEATKENINQQKKNLETENKLINSYQKMYAVYEKTTAGSKERKKAEEKLKQILEEINNIHPNLISNTVDFNTAQTALQAVYIKNTGLADEYNAKLSQLNQTQKELANRKFWDEYNKTVEDKLVKPTKNIFGGDTWITDDIKKAVYTGNVNERLENIDVLLNAANDTTTTYARNDNSFGSQVRFMDTADRTQMIGTLTELKAQLLKKDIENSQISTSSPEAPGTVQSNGTTSNKSTISDKLSKKDDDIRLLELREDGRQIHTALQEYKSYLDSLLKTKLEPAEEISVREKLSEITEKQKYTRDRLLTTTEIPFNLEFERARNKKRKQPQQEKEIAEKGDIDRVTKEKEQLIAVWREVDVVGFTAIESMRNNMDGFFGDIISGTRDIGSSFRNMLSNVAASFTSTMLKMAADQAFNWIVSSLASVGSGGIFGIIGSIFGFAEGGLVKGPGTGTSDSIPAYLSNGEFVVNSRATSKYYPLLQAINTNLHVPHFASGGFVGGGSLNSTTFLQPVVNISGSMELDLRTLRQNFDLISTIDNKYR